MTRVALRVPVAEGVKVSPTAQLADIARVEPQLLVCAKSAAFAPAIAMLETCKSAVPPLVRVTTDGRLWLLKGRFPNCTLAGDSSTEAAPLLLRGTIHVPTFNDG
jgi:hypothetical protein